MGSLANGQSIRVYWHIRYNYGHAKFKQHQYQYQLQRYDVRLRTVGICAELPARLAPTIPGIFTCLVFHLPFLPPVGGSHASMCFCLADIRRSQPGSCFDLPRGWPASAGDRHVQLPVPSQTRPCDGSSATGFPNLSRPCFFHRVNPPARTPGPVTASQLPPPFAYINPPTFAPPPLLLLSLHTYLLGASMIMKIGVCLAPCIAQRRG